MDGKIDLAVEQCPLDFFRENARCADVCNRTVLNQIAACLDNDDFDFATELTKNGGAESWMADVALVGLLVTVPI